MVLIKTYITEGKLLDDLREAQKLKVKAAEYTIEEGVLYRRSFYEPLLRCLSLDKAQYAT